MGRGDAVVFDFKKEYRVEAAKGRIVIRQPIRFGGCQHD